VELSTAAPILCSAICTYPACVGTVSWCVGERERKHAKERARAKERERECVIKREEAARAGDGA